MAESDRIFWLVGPLPLGEGEVEIDAMVSYILPLVTNTAKRNYEGPIGPTKDQ